MALVASEVAKEAINEQYQEYESVLKNHVYPTLAPCVLLVKGVGVR